MIKSILIKFAIISLLFTLSCSQHDTVQMKKILIITGGHEFEPSFYKIFDSFSDVEYDTISQPKFNERLKGDIADKYDVLVFYDMWQYISEGEKKAFINLLEEGQGMLFLHHSLVSYQQWDEFEKIIGGQYIEKDFYDDPDMIGSTYAEDITLEIMVADKNHPVTKSIDDFTIYDEGYQSITISADIHPLLSTAHPDCAPTVAWTNRYGKSRIVYILLGHGKQAHENKNYRKLVHNSIVWTAEQE